MIIGVKHSHAVQHQMYVTDAWLSSANDNGDGDYNTAGETLSNFGFRSVSFIFFFPFRQNSFTMLASAGQIIFEITHLDYVR